jgi:hypothetical protein
MAVLGAETVAEVLAVVAVGLVAEGLAVEVLGAEVLAAEMVAVGLVAEGLAVAAEAQEQIQQEILTWIGQTYSKTSPVRQAPPLEPTP